MQCWREGMALRGWSEPSTRFRPSILEEGNYSHSLLLAPVNAINFYALVPRWHSGKEPTCQCRKLKRGGFTPWARKIPGSRKWQLTPVFLPGESHGQRSLVGYSPGDRKELDTSEHTHIHTHSCVQLSEDNNWPLLLVMIGYKDQINPFTLNNQKMWQNMWNNNFKTLDNRTHERPLSQRRARKGRAYCLEVVYRL